MKNYTSTDVTYYTHFSSPVGRMLLTSDGTGLSGLYMEQYKHGEDIGEGWIENKGAQPFPETERQLEAYFTGTLTEFSIPLAMRGTPFQLRVWEELQTIPFGATISYGELARRVGNKGASRAVGLANGRNPVSIIVPCHRVIGSDGKLTGYGGGLPRKAALLHFEGSVIAGGARRFIPLTEETAKQDVIQFSLDFAS